jgi:hypothetical protein
VNKPDIIEMIGARVELRRAGRNHVTLCPFHEERTPSFSVSESWQTFHCFGCGASGDVIDFIRRLDGLTFKEACAVLGITTGTGPSAIITPARRRAGELARAWANDQRAKLNSMIAEWFELRDAADEVGLFDLAEILDRELVMLHGFYESLATARGVGELLAVRESIEGITAAAEDTL